MATQAQAVTDREITAAVKRYPNIEMAFKLNLGLTMEQDEAIDGCTVYEPDGYCPHGYRGLAQIRALWTV